MENLICPAALGIVRWVWTEPKARRFWFASGLFAYYGYS